MDSITVLQDAGNQRKICGVYYSILLLESDDGENWSIEN